MVRIADMRFDADVEYNGETVAVTIPKEKHLTDEQIAAIKNATTLERLDMNYGEEIGVIATYNLIGWKKVEVVRFGTRFVWQTYSLTDMEKLRQENEDLTAALLELAAIVGGGNG